MRYWVGNLVFAYRDSPSPNYMVEWPTADGFYGVKFYKWYNVIQALIKLREIVNDEQV